MISEQDFEELKRFIDQCIAREGLSNTTFFIFSPLTFVSDSFKGDEVELNQLLQQKKEQLEERIAKLGIYTVAHEYYVEAKQDELWNVPRVSDEELFRELRGQVEETIVRASQVGHTQAAEEIYQRGHQDLDRWLLANSHWRNLFGISESEL